MEYTQTASITFLGLNEQFETIDLTGTQKAGYKFNDQDDTVSIWADNVTVVVDRERFVRLKLKS